MPHLIKTPKGTFEIHQTSWGWGVLNLANGHVEQCKSEEGCWDHLRSHAPDCDHTTEQDDDFWGEPIHVYTRQQAIEDGVLVDLMQPETVGAVCEAGFKFPVAVTSEVFNDCIALTPAAEEAGNDLQGRLWDVLFVLRTAIWQSNPGTIIEFQIRCVVDSVRPKTVELKAVCGPDDDAKPCLTIMYPWQD